METTMILRGSGAGIAIIALDIFISTLVLVTVYLGVRHIFDHEFGDEADPFIASVVLLSALLYNWIITHQYTFDWNRGKLLLIIWSILIGVAGLFVICIKCRDKHPPLTEEWGNAAETPLNYEEESNKEKALTGVMQEGEAE